MRAQQVCGKSMQNKKQLDICKYLNDRIICTDEFGLSKVLIKLRNVLKNIRILFYSIAQTSS